MKRLLHASVGIATVVGLMLSPSLALAGATPPALNVTLDPGDTHVVDKTVTTPPIPPRPDIMFLADTTSSMSGAINNVKSESGTVLTQVLAAQSQAQFGVAHYTDQNCPNHYVLDQAITGDTSLVQAAVNGLSTPNQGCNTDAPEDFINALYHLATDGNVGWRSGSTRVVVLFGDSSSHDPSSGNTLAATITALNAAGIRVVAVQVPGTPGFLWNGLDSAGQATALVNATGGVLTSAGAPNQVVNAILAGLQNLPVTITPVAVGCSPLNVSFAPTSQTVISGTDANFVETISVPNDPSLAGSKIECSVEFRDNGNVIATQDITVTIPINLDLNPDTDVNELGPGADHTVTATVTDGNGAGASGKTVDFEVLSGPNAGKNGSSATDGSGEASFTYTANQGLAGLGTDSIEACVTDESNVEHCDTVTKEWVDTTPPDLTLPPDATNEATGPDGAVHNFVATATDSVDPSPVVVCDPPSGSIFPLGDTLITCTATDATGNSSSGAFTKTVVDTTPPECECAEGVNPDGETPRAPGNGGQGQNQDGFYRLLAEDIVDLDPQIFVVDTGEDNVFGTADDTAFGPFSNLTNIKYTEANGAKPSIKPGAGEVDWQIKGQGDAAIFAVDFSGNVSEPVFCRVPPPPQ